MTTLDIATASSCHAAKWRNTRTTWEDLAQSLGETTYTKETLKQYLSYSKDTQGKIKDVGGFVGGYLREGRRRKGYVEHRQVVSLDVDHGTLDVWLDFMLYEITGLMYTTHKHTPDSPRYRIVFPLDRKVSPDEYEAIARVVASWLDIEAFDDTTYQPTRLMYYPSTSRDGEFLFNRIDGEVLSADRVLAELPDWTDPTTWPVSSRVKDSLRPDHMGEKAEDPEDKDGIVGAFCRAYPMYDALSEFLGEEYTPCEELGDDRYSFAGGSTAGGLIVYDNKFAYSHHATDPAGGRLCNAFDLVRLHRFGDLDEGARADTAITKLPSYKAMADFAGRLTPVKKEIVRARRGQAEDYGEIEGEARETATADEWIAELETEGRGNAIKNTINNAVIILMNDENIKDRFGFNEFEQRETAIKALPWDKEGTHYPRPLSDSDDAQLRLYMERCYGLTKKENISDALTVVVRNNTYHPVRDYLDSVEWDGVERLDTLFIDLFGAADTEYTRAVTRKSFCAAVSRIYNPGCKYDYVLVIVGDQGVGKSTTLAKMGRDWFSDSMPTITGKEALEQIQGSWLIELGELAGLRKAEVDAVKHFISKKEDRFRVAYGRRVEHFPRRCVFFATTNEEDFLRDVTGNRRFWVVNCKGSRGTIDFKGYLTPGMVSLLWAEAKEKLAKGETLYLPEELEEEARIIQDRHLETDERSGLVRKYLERLLPENWDTLDLSARRVWLADEDNGGTVERTQTCVMELWAECLGKDPNSIARKDSFEIGRLMKAFRDWQKYDHPLTFKNYGRQKAYTKTEQPK